jgi:thiol-disulfide isomerase/thioredoxin
VLVGKQLVNFALYDLNGQPWEYRTQKRGKLVLLDFWSTDCLPCRRAIPDLRGLKALHGSKGLEIVGIAYENSGTPQDQAKRVAAFAAKNGMDYTLLLGSGRQCPVQTQFGVRAYPSLVLVGQNGWILWRHEGAMEPQKLAELDRTIRYWLLRNN